MKQDLALKQEINNFSKEYMNDINLAYHYFSPFRQMIDLIAVLEVSFFEEYITNKYPDIDFDSQEYIDNDTMYWEEWNYMSSYKKHDYINKLIFDMFRVLEVYWEAEAEDIDEFRIFKDMLLDLGVRADKVICNPRNINIAFPELIHESGLMYYEGKLIWFSGRCKYAEFS